MTLTEFLLARLADDERVARGLDDRDDTVESGLEVHDEPGLGAELVISKTRLLAECEAKRRLVELHSGDAEWCGYSHGGMGTHGDMGYGPEPLPVDCDTIKVLALPYADHPDYDTAWRP